MTKAELRKHFKAERFKLSEAEREAFSQSICNTVIALPEIQSANNIHLFLPIARLAEVNTTLLINALDKLGKKILTSITNTEDFSLKHTTITPETRFVKNEWDIEEPVSTQFVPATTIDVVLIPLLICDTNGQRIGYGKGYYDRFLSQCRPDTHFIGVNYFEPINASFDTEPSDIPLNKLVTPEKVVTFTA